jgi:hypothetical protein
MAGFVFREPTMKTRWMIYSLFFFALGCTSKIQHDEKAFIKQGDVYKLSVIAPSSNHRVRIEFNADSPVTCFVIMSSELQGKSADDLPGVPSAALEKKVDAQNGTLDVLIPRKDEFTVCFVPTRSSVNLTVKMTSLPDK